jgi:hypothetical protein
MGDLSGGSALTQRFAQKLNKPHFVVSLDPDESQNIAASIIDWLKQGNGQAHFATLNVAGPSEKRCPGIYKRVMTTLELLARH